jgi:hypothetical protein
LAPAEKAPPATFTGAEARGPEKNLARQALEHFQRSQEFLKQGNWAGYGDELKRVESLLRDMQTAP